MSYDFETTERGLSLPTFAPVDPKDLEALVMLLELAAIHLTKEPDTSFTEAEMIAEARNIAGDELVFDENDMRIVLGNVRFLKREGRGRYRIK